ncbi:MAG: fluoride efflux transporter CrcB [Phycisphaerae bacterium]|nr:fluoride efflux transporter CrcB [Phycisphaerae bacterium]MCZ2400549.1 fluoride efflux transporter CrcB [Phycisphaerae bacterium]NUQ48507.1 fluoride efflux transporter CrcB [Phycisphaerae bacterium]
MQKIALIALGGALGTLARYWLTGVVQLVAERLNVAPMPLGTLAVNVGGSLLIGVAMAYYSGPMVIAPQYRLALTIGLLGGFTTFSSFAYETLALANDRQLGLALANIVLTNVLGLAGAWAGYRLTQFGLGIGS